MPAAAAREGGLAAPWVAESDPYRLRPFPGEDVYLYSKRIDNSRVVRQADPLARRRCARTIATSFMAAVVLMLLLLPHGLTIIAGYQMHALERQLTSLKGERATLQYQESRLLSPARLNELANALRLVDPEPGRVIYANPAADKSAALIAPSK